MSMLEIDSISTYYGESRAINDVSLDVDQGEVVTLLGRNGAGKTTTLRSIMGINSPRRGSIHYNGEDITGMSVYDTARKGIGYVPESRDIWGDLTVEENLKIPAGMGGNRMIDDVYGIFPKLEELKESRGANLSGGEQQMLAIGRGILGGTELLLLDEASEGLAPQIVVDVRDALHRLKDEMTILMVEQNTEMALKIADRAYIYENGEIAVEASVQELRDNPDILQRHIVFD